MNYYSKDEPFIVGIDFDGTITPQERGSSDYPIPTPEFVEFYDWVESWNYHVSKKDKPISFKIYLCIHTARDLEKDDNYNYIKQYLSEYGFQKIFFPKRDGRTLKNLLGNKLEFPYDVRVNTKIPCSCFIDDLNLGTPKHRDGSINWRKIRKLLIKEVKRINERWI